MVVVLIRVTSVMVPTSWRRWDVDKRPLWHALNRTRVSWVASP